MTSPRGPSPYPTDHIHCDRPAPAMPGDSEDLATRVRASQSHYQP
jgi:hypothetical protein